MSERYNVAASAVLGENYKITSIECSDYNPAIDGTITVTISVNDVYGDAVSGESVTVTVSEGNFTQLNGSDITAASSVTGTTNSSGQFTLTYTCSEWGLITFSANTVNKQILVKGYKIIKNDSGIRVRVNGDSVECRIVISSTTFTTSFTQFTGQTIPEGYRPNTTITMPTYNNTNLLVAVQPNGNIMRRSMTGSNYTGACDCLLTWKY